jgi:hypothetical protein
MMPSMADMKRPPDLSEDEYLAVIKDLLRLHETQTSIETWPRERRHVLALAGGEFGAGSGVRGSRPAPGRSALG